MGGPLQHCLTKNLNNSICKPQHPSISHLLSGTKRNRFHGLKLTFLCRNKSTGN